MVVRVHAQVPAERARVARRVAARGDVWGEWRAAARLRSDRSTLTNTASALLVGAAPPSPPSRVVNGACARERVVAPPTRQPASSTRNAVQSARHSARTRCMRRAARGAAAPRHARPHQTCCAARARQQRGQPRAGRRYRRRAGGRPQVSLLHRCGVAARRCPPRPACALLPPRRPPPYPLPRPLRRELLLLWRRVGAAGNENLSRGSNPEDRASRSSTRPVAEKRNHYRPEGRAGTERRPGAATHTSPARPPAAAAHWVSTTRPAATICALYPAIGGVASRCARLGATRGGELAPAAASRSCRSRWKRRCACAYRRSAHAMRRPFSGSPRATTRGAPVLPRAADATRCSRANAADARPQLRDSRSPAGGSPQWLTQPACDRRRRRWLSERTRRCVPACCAATQSVRRTAAAFFLCAAAQLRRQHWRPERGLGGSAPPLAAHKRGGGSPHAGPHELLSPQQRRAAACTPRRRFFD